MLDFRAEHPKTYVRSTQLAAQSGPQKITLQQTEHSAIVCDETSVLIIRPPSHAQAARGAEPRGCYLWPMALTES
jgi:hypothetical protein